MNTVMVMAASGGSRATSCRVPWRACFGYHRTMLVGELRLSRALPPGRTAGLRLGRRNRLGDAEMIAGRVEGAQTVAIGRIAQPHAEHGLELVVACPNAPVVEA